MHVVPIISFVATMLPCEVTINLARRAAASCPADPGLNLFVSMLQRAWPTMNRGHSDLNSSIATIVRL